MDNESVTEKEDKMQGMMQRRHSLGSIVTEVLLSIQGILGLLFSLPLLAGLLAPGRPVIVSGRAIFAGPAGGVSLVVALASFVIAWGLWMWKPWAHQRTVLLEIISLALWAFELIEPDINRGVPLARMIIAALILVCLYASPSLRALSRA
jgi:hypothetical protein